MPKRICLLYDNQSKSAVVCDVAAVIFVADDATADTVVVGAFFKLLRWLQFSVHIMATS